MSRKRTLNNGSESETTTAVAEVTAAEATSFADKAGQRSGVAAPDPFNIASDILSGVRLFESRQDRLVAIQFGEGRPEEKPSPAVLAKLKESGFRWNPSDRIWTRPVSGDSARSTRIEAEQLFQEVSRMIRQEKGIESGQEVPF